VRKRERERERDREGERRERCRISLKGMTGALAPFSYLVPLYSYYLREIICNIRSIF